MSYGITNWWPGGSTVAVAGTYTRTGGAGTGIVDVGLPTDDDEAIFMYGVMTIGAAKAGGADTATVEWISTGAATLATIESLAMNVNEVLNLPTAFADAAVAVANAIGMRDIPTLMLTSTDNMRFSLAGMANTETFLLRLRFRSRSGAAPVGAPTGGTFA